MNLEERVQFLLKSRWKNVGIAFGGVLGLDKKTFCVLKPTNLVAFDFFSEDVVSARLSIAGSTGSATGRCYNQYGRSICHVNVLIAFDVGVSFGRSFV
jgi:hypothetical protein